MTLRTDSTEHGFGVEVTLLPPDASGAAAAQLAYAVNSTREFTPFSAAGATSSPKMASTMWTARAVLALLLAAPYTLIATVGTRS